MPQRGPRALRSCSRLRSTQLLHFATRGRSLTVFRLPSRTPATNQRSMLSPCRRPTRKLLDLTSASSNRDARDVAGAPSPRPDRRPTPAKRVDPRRHQRCRPQYRPGTAGPECSVGRVAQVAIACRLLRHPGTNRVRTCHFLMHCCAFVLVCVARGEGFDEVDLADHSHSIVAGGFELMSYTTRLTPGTSLTIREEIFPRTSYGSFAQSAVMPSSDVTARIATTLA